MHPSIKTFSPYFNAVNTTTVTNIKLCISYANMYKYALRIKSYYIRKSHHGIVIDFNEAT